MPRLDRHSRLVGWLKVALPLSALALLSTLFLLADRIDPTAAIRYAEVDVEDLVRDPRMTAPTYAGTTSDGSAITMTASAARPATGTRTAGASDVVVRLDMPGGGSTDIRAKDAELDTGTDQLRLSGGVEIDTSSGFHIVTERLTTALDRSGAASDSAVTASGPQVTIDADSFTLTQQSDTGAASPYLLVFSGSVKLVYEPGAPGRETDTP
ncbi:LPS export ABC transporter periplasmic protein LptC [Gemmobacter sp. 24YEA27]|uniref:LPS export ABC transporter periplasmic protein LptC n=1 Tax=Gemmobacter sp. 24YEA27 TaxID=3040672 RepID=UPI0024B3669B|nr:LPS export ABC transporter periplasmic protein LptC [Gemmobacter sp. 24YEA27]